jgi:tetratricopeptide (TPR) repeat protein
MLGTVLSQQGATAEALAEFRATIKLRPASAEAHVSLGQMLAQAGDSEGAAAALAEAERLNRKKADAQASSFAVAVGLERLKAGDLAGAIDRARVCPGAHRRRQTARRRREAPDALTRACRRSVICSAWRTITERPAPPRLPAGPPDRSAVRPRIRRPRERRSERPAGARGADLT